MKPRIEKLYPLYRKVRRYLLQNIDGIQDDSRKKEFVNNFMMQMLILWFIQEKEFFNEDKNYFITRFKELYTNKSLNGFKNYFEFLIYFLEKINLHLNQTFFEDVIVGKIIIPGPAIFLNIDANVKMVSIPNKCFYNEKKTDLLVKNSSRGRNNELPLFNFFESEVGNFDGFFLGGIYEN